MQLHAASLQFHAHAIIEWHWRQVRRCFIHFIHTLRYVSLDDIPGFKQLCKQFLHRRSHDNIMHGEVIAIDSIWTMFCSIKASNLCAFKASCLHKERYNHFAIWVIVAPKKAARAILAPYTIIVLHKHRLFNSILHLFILEIWLKVFSIVTIVAPDKAQKWIITLKRFIFASEFINQSRFEMQNAKCKLSWR